MSDPAGVEAVLAEVLAEHATYAPEWDEERTTGESVYWRYRCKCGELLPAGGSADQKHRAHQAAVLAPLLADRERAAAEAAVQVFVHPNRADERDVRPWQPSDGDRRCQQCGIPNVVWYTDHELWNLVMPDGGVLCIGCFIHRAEAFKGVGTVWALMHQSSDLNDDFRRGVSAGMAIRARADALAHTKEVKG